MNLKSLLFFFSGILLGGIGLWIFVQYADLPYGKKSEIKEVVVRDTIYIEQEPEIQIQKVVEKVDVINQDTIMLLSQINTDTGEYVVLRDKLLKSVSVKIAQNEKPKGNQPSDELTQKIDSDQPFGKTILVEFWQSPIDYQGYRLNKTKLVLFGINPDEGILLTANDNQLSMQAGSFNTILTPSDKYRSFSFK